MTDALAQEVLTYFRFLLEHEGHYALASCPLCLTLTDVCDLTASLLFPVNFYPGVSAAPPPPRGSAPGQFTAAGQNVETTSAPFSEKQA